MMRLRLQLLGILLAAFLVCTAAPIARADDWKPIPPEEMSLKDSPTHPGAHAIVLYREELGDDTLANIRYYKRIKILTEEGRKYGDIELPFLKELSRISDIKARTVRPDGTSIEFKGEIFEKTIVKGRGVKFLAKTFTLPEVQPGCIIEYRWKEQWDEREFPTLRWLLQEDIPTLHAYFARKPYSQFALRWVGVGLEQGTNAQEDKRDRQIKLELQNIPPFEEEDFMPPRTQVVMRVDFYYVAEVKTQDEYWRDVGKRFYEEGERFMGKYGEIAQEAARVVDPGDPAETKLRKLYARAQQIRNLSYERNKTEKEEKREKLKKNNNAKDVLKNGYGTAWDILFFFGALVRGADFDTSIVHLSKRNQYFFEPVVQDSRHLNDPVVLVKADGKEYYLDPANPFAPFGLLSWAQTGVRGMRVHKQGGDFLLSPQPDSSFAITERTARLKINEDGDLEGDLTVQFHGQAALSRRVENYDEDEAGKKKEIEDELKGWLPATAKIEIKSIENWEGTEEPLRVQCSLAIPGFAVVTGRRMLISPAVFHAGRQHPFQGTKRVHPIYFRYPFRELDDITIDLPEGFHVEGTPQPRDEQYAFATFKIRSQISGSTLQFHRLFAMEGFLFRTEYYNALRTFYDRIGTADDERVVLRSTEGSNDE